MPKNTLFLLKNLEIFLALGLRPTSTPRIFLCIKYLLARPH